MNRAHRPSAIGLLQPCIVAVLIAGLATTISSEELPTLPEGVIAELARRVAGPDPQPLDLLAALGCAELGADGELPANLRRHIQTLAATPEGHALDSPTHAIFLAEAALALWNVQGDSHEALRLAAEAKLAEIVGGWLHAPDAEAPELLKVSELSHRLVLLHLARACGTRVPAKLLASLGEELAKHLDDPGQLATVLWAGGTKPAGEAAAELRKSLPAAEQAAERLCSTDTGISALLLVYRRSAEHNDTFKAWRDAFVRALASRPGLHSEQRVANIALLFQAFRGNRLAFLADRAPGAPRADLRAVMNDTRFGPLVLSVEADGAAERAGLMPGDVLSHLGKQRLRDTSDLNGALHDFTEADEVTARVENADGPRQVLVELDRRRRIRTAPVGKLQNPEDPLEGKNWEGWDNEDYARLPMPKDPARVERKTLEELAQRAMTSLPWRSTLEDALTKAASIGRPIFWYLPQGWKPDSGHAQASSTYAGSDYDTYLRTTLFHSPVTRELLDSRFILLNQNPTKAQAEKYGILRFRFYDPGWIVLAPDGSKLWQMDRIATYSEEIFEHALRSFLALHPELAFDCQSPDVTPPILLATGRLADLLFKTSTGPAQPPQNLLCRAHGLLQLRRFGEARADLVRALDLVRRLKPHDADAASELALQCTDLALKLALREGDMERAARWAEVLATAGLPAFQARGLEARASLSWRRGDLAAAAADFRRLVAEHPDTPSGWWAADCLLGKAAAQHAVEPVETLDERLFLSLPESTTLPCPPEAAPELAARATRALISWQSADGSWRDTPYAWEGPQHRPNTYMAITGIAARALLLWREVAPEAVDAALARAEGYLRDHGNFGVTPLEKCYGYAYPLRYWVERGLGLEGDARATAFAEAARLAAKLGEIQEERAGWGHEYYNPFATAICLESLAVARSAGVETPAGAIDRGRVSLESQRHPAGGYPYSFGGSDQTMYASVGRTPACEFSLVLAGGSTRLRLIDALSNFFENFEQLAAVRQYDFHSDKFANGGFFYWHDMLPVAEAIAHLNSTGAEEHFGKQLRTIITATAEAGGGWCDSQNIGRAYGTAMSLLCLRALDPPAPPAAAEPAEPQ